MRNCAEHTADVFFFFLLEHTAKYKQRIIRKYIIKQNYLLYKKKRMPKTKISIFFLRKKKINE